MLQGFFIPFIDGLSNAQNGEETSTYENIIKSIDTSFGELLTGAIAGYGALWLVGAVLPYIVGGFILMAFLIGLIQWQTRLPGLTCGTEKYVY